MTIFITLSQVENQATRRVSRTPSVASLWPPCLLWLTSIANVGWCWDLPDKPNVKHLPERYFHILLHMGWIEMCQKLRQFVQYNSNLWQSCAVFSGAKVNQTLDRTSICYYSKFYRLFVTLSAPGDVKSVRCAFFFYFWELTWTKITSPICSTTAVDKNLDSHN